MSQLLNISQYTHLATQFKLYCIIFCGLLRYICVMMMRHLVEPVDVRKMRTIANNYHNDRVGSSQFNLHKRYFC